MISGETRNFLITNTMNGLDLPKEAPALASISFDSHEFFASNRSFQVEERSAITKTRNCANDIPSLFVVQFEACMTPTSAVDSQSQNTSLHRLQHVEKRIVHVLELAGGVMDELTNSAAPRIEVLNNHCREFMQSIKDIQLTLREEIKSACEYRPFEKCDYHSRISNEICCKKLEYVIKKLDGMKQSIDQYNSTF